MSNLRISIALCTYNGEKYLSQQLTSFLQQTRPPDELVVCDDNSKDTTVALLTEFATRAPFPVRLYTNHVNIGSTKNFEQAIRLCAGDLIALSDQDDVWLPDKLRLSEEALMRNPGVAGVFSDATLVDKDLRAKERRLWEAIGFNRGFQARFSGEYAVKILLRQNIVTGATLVFRSQCRDLILPIPSYVVHDSWIALLLTMTVGITFIDTPLMLYRLHGNNQIGVQDSETLFERFLKPTIAKRKKEFAPKLQQLIDIQNRLTITKVPVKDENMLRLLQARIIHLQTRLSLPDNRLRRTLPILKEFAAGRYSTFSNGILSATKDLLLP